MTVITQGVQPFEFLKSEDDSTSYSRDVLTVTVAGGVSLPSGTELGKITATGKYIKRASAASDGSQTAVAILGTPLVGVANGDYQAVCFTRACEVIGDRLNGMTGPTAGAAAQLLAVGIVVR